MKRSIVFSNTMVVVVVLNCCGNDDCHCSDGAKHVCVSAHLYVGKSENTYTVPHMVSLVMVVHVVRLRVSVFICI